MTTRQEIEDKLEQAEVRHDLLNRSIKGLGSKAPMKSRRLSEDARKEAALISDLQAQLKVMS